VPVLYDTSVLIDGETLDLSAVQEEVVLISAVSIGELAHGLGRGTPEEQRLRVTRFRRLVEGYEILPFDVEEAKFYGVLSDLLRAAGRNPRPRRLDLKIAATAAAARVPVVTTNPRDFQGLERLVEVVAVRPA
jgi:predicted nucleic acid-binding protein